MVRMARLGLAMAPTLYLKVLTNFRLSLVTVKRLVKEVNDAKEFKTSLAAGKNARVLLLNGLFRGQQFPQCQPN